jgi:cytoskeletal protein CcmA (bactofilin family)
MWGMNGKTKSPVETDENFTFLGKGVRFNGVVHFDGTVRIDGRLEGEIHTKGTLIVGEHALIKGTITAGTITSGGKIQGNITAAEKVHFLKTAVMIGDVRTPAFSMEDGAHFHGLCDMGVKALAEDAVPHEQESEKVPDNVHRFAAHRGKVRAQESP